MVRARADLALDDVELEILEKLLREHKAQGLRDDAQRAVGDADEAEVYLAVRGHQATHLGGSGRSSDSSGSDNNNNDAAAAAAATAAAAAAAAAAGGGAAHGDHED